MALDIFKLSGTIDIQTGRAEANLKRVNVSAHGTQSALNRAEDAGQKAGRGIAAGLGHGAASAGKLGSAVSALQSKLNSLRAPSLNFGSGAGGGLGSIASIAGGNLLSGAITSALSAVGGALKDGITAGIGYNKMLEKANISFTTLLGSTDKAQQHLKALQAFGEATPFEFPDLIKASQRMQAMGFAADKVIPSLRSVGDAVSAVGGGKEELDGVVLALGQMQTKGKVSAEEMNQLAERGIPAWDLLAKAIGRTKAETIELSGQGRLGGGRAVEGIVAMMGERFGGQMDQMAKTLEGRESNFNDILQRQLGAATQTNTEQLKAAYEKATIGLATTGAQAFAVEMNKLTGEIGKLAEPALMGLATGEYFTSGASVIGATAGTIGKNQKQAEDIGKGNYLDALIGRPGERMPKIEPGGLADRGLKSLGQKFGLIGSDASRSFTDGVASGTAGAQAAGAAVGGAAEAGVKASLQQRSPSKVMLDLGFGAAQSFVDAFSATMEAGKKKISKSPVDVEKMRAAIIADLQKLREDPRIKAMLDTIASAEGADYNTLFGGGKFKDFAAHPNTPITKKLGGKELTSTAAGRYQFLSRTWAGVQNQTGLKDFSQQSQDLGAIHLMRQRGMIEPILRGDVSGALAKGNREWASLPGSPYGQPTKRADDLISTYNASLEKLTSETGLLAQAFSALSQIAAPLKQMIAGMLPGATSAAKAPVSAPLRVPATPGATAINAGAAAALPPLAPLAAGIAKLVPPAVLATKAVEALPTPTAVAGKAMEMAGSRAGEFADAITATGKAVAEAKDHFAQFKDALASGFDSLFDSALNGDKLDFKSFGKSLFKGLTDSIISGMTGGKASSPGQLLGGLLTGGFGGAGAGSAGPFTPGFAGGPGAGAYVGGGGSGGGGGIGGAIGTAQNVGGLFSKGGALSKLPGLGKIGGLLGKIPGLSKLGSLFGLGGGGAAAGAGAAGAGGAAGAAGTAALFSNPVTAIIGGALIAAPFIAKLFAKDPLADYRKHIKREYGIDVKSKAVLGKVMQAGQSRYGEEWQKRKIETVRLPEVRDMLSEYAGGFGLRGATTKLFDARTFGDAFASVNQFKVGLRAMGGPVLAGMPYIVGERRPELFIPNQSGRIAPSVQGGGGGRGIISREMMATFERMAAALERFEAMPADHVVMTGLARRPGLATQDVRRSFDTRDEHSRAIRDLNFTR